MSHDVDGGHNLGLLWLFCSVKVGFFIFRMNMMLDVFDEAVWMQNVEAHACPVVF